MEGTWRDHELGNVDDYVKECVDMLDSNRDHF